MHVYVLNMPKQVGRRAEMEAALDAQMFPEDKVHIWSKTEECGSEYATTSRLMRAAVLDGFPIFQRWRKDATSRTVNIGVMGHTWSIFRVWRDAEQYGYPIMFLHDDWLPTQPYDFYLDLIEHAKTDSGEDWEIICLQGEEQHWCLEGDRERDPVNDTLIRGLSERCGDVGYIISRKGVEWIKTCFENKFWFIEELFLDTPNQPNTYTVSEPCLRCIQPEHQSTIYSEDGTPLHPEKIG